MRIFFFSASILAFQPTTERVTPAKPRNRPCASSEWVHLLSEIYPMQKSACLPAQFESLPTSKHLIQQIWSASKSKNRPIFDRGTASDYFSSDYAPWAKTQTTPVEKRIFELGTSRRDWIGSEKCMTDFVSLTVKNEHERKKKVIIERDKIWSE